MAQEMMWRVSSAMPSSFWGTYRKEGSLASCFINSDKRQVTSGSMAGFLVFKVTAQHAHGVHLAVEAVRQVAHPQNLEWGVIKLMS